MDANTKTLLVIWHSRTNAAKLAAQAACDSARKIRQELGQQDEIIMLNANEVTFDLLLQADAYLFCAPENLASLSGAMKEFFDRFYYDLLGNIEGRPYSAIITAGSDGQGALRQLQRICTGWRLNEKVPAIILNTASQTKEEILAPKSLSAEQLAQAAEVGGTLYAWL